MDNLLHAEHLIKRYPQGPREIEILHGIDITLRAGERVAITGPSGAGKSTLLHILGLMDTPSAGTLFIQNVDAGPLSAVERARLRNRTIGFLFQFHHLLPELTVLENVCLPRRIRGDAHAPSLTEAKQLLDTMGLGPHQNQKPATLSGGEQQRTALARALINHPALLLADEPTGNLDKDTGERVLQLIWDQSRRFNTTTVLVTHQEDIAARADRVIHLRDGRLTSTTT